MIYGGSANKCMSMMGISKAKGTALFNYFWEYNVGLKKLRDRLVNMYKSKGHIIGIDGRQLMIRAEYKLLNSLFQSAAAIIFKQWLILCCDALDAAGLDIELIISYHDEIQLRCHEDDVEVAIPIIERTCSEAGEMLGVRVPIKADVMVGMNWFQTH